MSFAYVIAFTYISAVIGDQIVTTKQGQLNGTVLRSRDDKAFYAFYGIPYAAAPVGEFRFSAPQKPPSWEGIRDASQKAPVCLQSARFTNTNASFVGQEDCLYLSVFTPQIKPDKPLPVLVYIHGGAFHKGSGDNRGAHFFMNTSIVVVTMNYRLGILGFLSAGDTVVPGNYQLKDQVAALKWIQSNIAHFGGDPESVTIQGQSSGSVCVHLHTMSPLSKGLFHRAIMHSGSALSYWSYSDRRDTKRAFTDVVKRANCQYNATVEMLSCLRNMSAQQLISIQQSILVDEQVVLKFVPVIEWPEIENSFLTISPDQFPYQNTSIPWIIGFNSAEGIVHAIMLLKQFGYGQEGITREFRRMLFSHSKFAYEPEKLSNSTAALMQFYFDNGTVHENDQQRICNLFSDIVFGMPILSAAYNYAGPKYFYYYDYQYQVSSDTSFFNLKNTFGIKGSGHSDELLSLFLNRFSDKLNDADVKHSRKMITYWSNFIIHGTPNSQTGDFPHWDMFEPETSNYLYIGNDKIISQKYLLSERYAFWKALLA